MLDRRTFLKGCFATAVALALPAPTLVNRTGTVTGLIACDMGITQQSYTAVYSTAFYDGKIWILEGRNQFGKVIEEHTMLPVKHEETKDE